LSERLSVLANSMSLILRSAVTRRGIVWSNIFFMREEGPGTRAFASPFGLFRFQSSLLGLYYNWYWSASIFFRLPSHHSRLLKTSGIATPCDIATMLAWAIVSRQRKTTAIAGSGFS
jgi:hypothetical protein